MLRTAGQSADGYACIRSIPSGTLPRNACRRSSPGSNGVAGPAKIWKSLPADSLPPARTKKAVERMSDYIRFRIAFYCSTKAYWNVLKLHGMEELGLKLRPFPAQNRWDEMAAQIPDDVLRLFAVVGTHDGRGSDREPASGGLTDAISLFIPTDTEPGPLGEIAQDVRRIETPFQAYSNDWSTAAGQDELGKHKLERHERIRLANRAASRRGWPGSLSFWAAPRGSKAFRLALTVDPERRATTLLFASALELSRARTGFPNAARPGLRSSAGRSDGVETGDACILFARADG